MTLVIPGVQVTVVKEVVPPQLSPSGVLGLIGLTEKKLEKTERASSWSRFIEVCGPASAYSLPEARLALGNGVFELVIVPIKPDNAARATAGLRLSLASFSLTAKSDDVTATVKSNPKTFDLTITPKSGDAETYKALTNTQLSEKLKDSGLVTVGDINTAIPPVAGEYALSKDSAVAIPGDLSIGVEARAPGIWANKLKLQITYRADKFDLAVRSPDATASDPPIEVHRNLDANNFADKLNKDSAVIRVKDGTAPDVPDEGEYILAGGTDAIAKDYIDALEWLKDEDDVDMVLAAIQDFSNSKTVSEIYSGVISHCQNMSTASKGRLGFGQVPPNTDLATSLQISNTLLSDRFVLLAPHGVVGAVAGRIGSLDYFQSPTFKTLSGLTSLSRAIPLEEQSQLLQGNTVPVVDQRGRGVIVLRGLTTDGDQISVRRVADRAVRGVKMLGELFIGRLNNEEGRGALKQKLAEFLVQMQKDGAIVPSTDGKDPAFKLDVYSSQADFAMGIVRVDIAVRPVRAIDFIYATILVQV